MICGDSCFSILVCCSEDVREEKLTESSRRGREIVLDRQNIKIEHFHLEKLKHIECHSNSSGSESDSGLGSELTGGLGTSVLGTEKLGRKSFNSKQESTQDSFSLKSPEPQIMDRESTICTVTRADSLATLDQDCHS